MDECSWVAQVPVHLQANNNNDTVVTKPPQQNHKNKTFDCKWKEIHHLVPWEKETRNGRLGTLINAHGLRSVVSSAAQSNSHILLPKCSALHLCNSRRRRSRGRLLGCRAHISLLTVSPFSGALLLLCTIIGASLEYSLYVHWMVVWWPADEWGSVDRCWCCRVHWIGFN